MRTRYLLLLSRLVGVFAVMAFCRGQAAAQVVLGFPQTPCGSIVCDSIVIANTSDSLQVLLAVEIRDSVSYLIGGDLGLPRTIPAGDSLVVPVCFAPNRRGNIVDSLLAVIDTSGGTTLLRARLAGRGIGADLRINPIVVNFPRTSALGTSTETIVIGNSGELPYVLTTAALNLPLPFRVTTPLPVTIMPGDSVEIMIAFQPLENGVYSTSVDITAGCAARLQLGLNGATELVGTGAVLRLSKVGFNPANNEQTPCNVPRCTDLTFSNAGSAPLIIHSLEWQRGDQGFTFTNPPQVPFTVPPNSQRSFGICITGQERSLLADTLLIASNTRSSIAFGMVIDVSGSMTDTVFCGADTSSRIEQAIIHARNFIQSALLHIPSIGIQDQLAISSYSTTSGIGPRRLRINYPYKLASVTAAERLAAQNAISTLTADGGTPTGAALQQMIDTLAKSPLHNRVIVLLTDGEAEPQDLKDFPLSSTIERAKLHGVRVFTISLGLSSNTSAVNYLRTLASETDGASFDASDNDCQMLQTAFESITDLVSRGAKHEEVFSIKVIAPSIAATSALRFDSVYVNDTVCSSVTLTNNGEGVALVDAIDLADMLGGATGEFSLPPDLVFPIRIPESEMVEVPVCFNPHAIRTHGGKLTFHYNNCGQEPIVTELGGAAYARANLRLSDLRIGLPGDVVTMPLYADSSMSGYGVRTITSEIRWNSSMLDLRAVRSRAGASGATVELAGPVRFAGNRAIATITVTHGGMNQESINGGGELAELEFQVLRGDALFSEVTLASANFEDGNPRTLLDNAGMIAFDSTCFRDAKPISNAAATKIIIGDAAPLPAPEGMVSIPVRTDGETVFQVELYGAGGELVRPAEFRTIGAGAGRIDLDLSWLPAGSYYATLKSGLGETFFRKIILIR